MHDSKEGFLKLIERHPNASVLGRYFKDPGQSCALNFSAKDVLEVIHSFPPRSYGGPDGIRPWHIIDIVSCKASGRKLLSAITSFTNMLLDG